MLIDLGTDQDNWRKWGALVKDWVEGKARPADTTALYEQMEQAGIKNATIAGTMDSAANARTVRPVQFVDYLDEGYLYIPLPSAEMLRRGNQQLADIAARDAGEKGYPLPKFYNAAFGAKKTVDMDNGPLADFGLCRLGEYVIQECQ